MKPLHTGSPREVSTPQIEISVSPLEETSAF